MMSNILEEIKQEVDQERWLSLWKKYQNHVYSGVTAVLVIAAGMMWWQNHQTSKTSIQSNEYTQALVISESDPERAFKIFEHIPAKGETIYAQLSRFWVAAILLERGDTKGAKELYDIIYQNSSGLFASSSLKILGQLAQLHGLYIEIDTVDPQIIIQKATPYASADSPWRHLGNELLGLSYLKKGDKEKARSSLHKILEDPKVPAAFKVRAQAIINYLNTDQK
ncbi:MAG TPA: hypothetical protein DEZ09_02885 [Holosporales bacterium]|nr:hypothetical protein [Holosporales bacterium]